MLASPPSRAAARASGRSDRPQRVVHTMAEGAAGRRRGSLSGARDSSRWARRRMCCAGAGRLRRSSTPGTRRSCRACRTRTDMSSVSAPRCRSSTCETHPPSRRWWRKVRARAAEMRDGDWILGRGWDQNRWPVAEWPAAGPLDAAAPRNPVFLTTDRRPCRTGEPSGPRSGSNHARHAGSARRTAHPGRFGCADRRPHRCRPVTRGTA